MVTDIVTDFCLGVVVVTDIVTDLCLDVVMVTDITYLLLVTCYL